MKIFFTSIFLAAALLHGNRALAQEPEAPTVSADVFDEDLETGRECLLKDEEGPDPGWAVFEKSIPACKRAVVIFERGVLLDLGAKRLVHVFSSGVTLFRATVVSGKGNYNAGDKPRDLAGKTVWVSLDLCQMKQVILRDAKNNDVARFKKARFIEGPEELSGISDGDQFKDFQNYCSPEKD